MTDGQLVNGFDAFYKDPQNRAIKVDEAAIADLRQIAGDPPDVIKALTDRPRAKYNHEIALLNISSTDFASLWVISRTLL